MRSGVAKKVVAERDGLGVIVNAPTWGWCELARVLSTVRVRRMLSDWRLETSGTKQQVADPSHAKGIRKILDHRSPERPGPADPGRDGSQRPETNTTR